MNNNNNNNNFSSENNFNFNQTFTNEKNEIFSEKINSRNEKVSFVNTDWNTKRKITVEKTFNNFREKLRKKVFERKFEMIQDNESTNNNIDQDVVYDLGKRINLNDPQSNAIDKIKEYIQNGSIKEDCYLFENFDFKSEISYCVFCDNNVYLIDKKLIICAGNCYNFTVNPNVMKIHTLDEVVSLLTIMLKEHINCRDEIVLFEDDFGGVSFFCSNLMH